MTRFALGFGYLATGLRLIWRPGLRRFALIPVLINIVVFALLGILSYRYFSAWLQDFAPSGKWGDFTLVRWFFGLIKFLFVVLFLLVSAFTFTIVANIIGAPFNSLLAERVEAALKGQRNTEQHESVLAMLRSIPRSMFTSLYLLFWLLPIGILYLIPGLNMLAPFVMFAFTAWVFAVEYLEYPMGNHGMGFGEVKKQFRQKRLLGWGFGCAVALMSAIPVLNLVAMPAAVAGATALFTAQFNDH